MMQHLISKTTGFLANRNLGALSHFIIRRYMQHYQVDLSDALIQNIKQYQNFNEFFTRKLKTGARPIDPEPNIMCSPTDGLIVQCGQLQQQQWTIKNHCFSLDALLMSPTLAKRYQHGYSVNIYLSPKDYHRIHMPFDGRLTQSNYIKGALYSVNPNHRHLKFINRNERLLCEFYNEQIGHFIVMMIGAFNVGSIHTVWPHSRNPQTYTQDQGIQLNKGDEMGYFAMGSSVLLISEQPYQACQAIAENKAIRMGQALIKTDAIS